MSLPVSSPADIKRHLTEPRSLPNPGSELRWASDNDESCLLPVCLRYVVLNPPSTSVIKKNVRVLVKVFDQATQLVAPHV